MMIFYLQWSFCGNHTDAGYHKYERSFAEMPILQDYAERIIAIHSEGIFYNYIV